MPNKNRQIQYQPMYIGHCGYRSDSTIDRKHFSGIERGTNIRNPHASLATSNIHTG